MVAECMEKFQSMSCDIDESSPSCVDGGIVVESAKLEVAEAKVKSAEQQAFSNPKEPSIENPSTPPADRYHVFLESATTAIPGIKIEVGDKGQLPMTDCSWLKSPQKTLHTSLTNTRLQEDFLMTTRATTGIFQTPAQRRLDVSQEPLLPQLPYKPQQTVASSFLALSSFPVGNRQSFGAEHMPCISIDVSGEGYLPLAQTLGRACGQPVPVNMLWKPLACDTCGELFMTLPVSCATCCDRGISLVFCSQQCSQQHETKFHLQSQGFNIWPVGQGPAYRQAGYDIRQLIQNTGVPKLEFAPVYWKFSG